MATEQTDPIPTTPDGLDAFVESLMDTDLYSMGAFFCDQHPELVEEVVDRSSEIERTGLSAYASGLRHRRRGGLRNAAHRPLRPLLQGRGRVVTL